MKVYFIKIQDLRYRLQTIKLYEPFKNESGYGLYIYFSALNRTERRYHIFKTKSQRDKVLTYLDEYFGVKY